MLRTRFELPSSHPLCPATEACQMLSCKCAGCPIVRRQGEKVKSEAGFSLTELVVVLAIMLVVSGLSFPSISRTIDEAKLNSAAEQLASFYAQGRIRATQDNNYYILPLFSAVNQPSSICLDLNGDGICSATEPQAQLAAGVSLNNRGIPVEMDATTLGSGAFMKTETSAGYSAQGLLEPGLAWNSVGLPCQRASSTSPCSGPVAWIQYLQLRRSAGDILYAAVTVNSSGSVKIWHYRGGGGRNWF
jgi:prepilin-type N-terminal cleavage/methylation domain-containing protein